VTSILCRSVSYPQGHQWVSDFGRGVSDSTSRECPLSSSDRAKALTFKWIAVALMWLRSCS
jgi:hypothetical protein